MSQWRDFKASLFHFCKLVSDQLAIDGVAQLEVFNFDAHADINDLPNSDVIGVAELQLENDLETQELTCMIGVSTLNDTNLLRMDRIVDFVYANLAPGQMLQVVSANNGSPIGWMKVKRGTAVFAVSKTKVRPLQFIAVALGTDQTGP